jgi:hypothetical protein
MALIYFVVFPGTALGNGLYAVHKVFLIMWPILATAWLLEESILPLAWMGCLRAKDAFVGAGLGVLIVAAMFGLMHATPLGAVVEAGSGQIAEKVRGMGVLNHFLAFALFLSVIHSLIEEVYWRWFVFGNLAHLISKCMAHVVAALGFSAHHILVLSQFFPLWLASILGLCVGIGGLLWSLLRERQGALWGAWVSHMVVDLGIMWLGAGLIGLR